MNARLSIMGFALATAACGGGGPGAGFSPFPSDAVESGSTGDSANGTTGGTSSAGSGSGSASSQATAAGAAEGLWLGTTDSGYSGGVLVLETGEFWSVYGIGNVLYGAAHGTGSGTDSTFTGVGTDYFFANATVTQGSVVGSVTPKASLTATVKEGGATATFTGNYDARYDTPALLSDIAGTWPFNAISPAGVQSGSSTIASDGSFAGQISTCAFSGQATPRPTGKNVFNATVTFAASGCLFNGATVSGVAVLTTNGATRTLIAVAVLPGSNAGFLASGTK